MELFNVCFDSFVQQLPGFNPDTAVLCYREVMGRKGLEQLPAASSLRKSLGGSKRAAWWGGLAGDGFNWSFGLCNADDGFIILGVKQGSLVPS